VSAKQKIKVGERLPYLLSKLKAPRVFERLEHTAERARGRGMALRAVPRGAARGGGVRPRGLGSAPAHPPRPVPGPQDARGLRPAGATGGGATARDAPGAAGLDRRARRSRARATGSGSGAPASRPPPRLRRYATPPERPSRLPSGALCGARKWRTIRRPLTLVVPIPRVMRIPALRHWRHLLRRRSRLIRSSVRIAEALAIASRPDLGCEQQNAAVPRPPRDPHGRYGAGPFGGGSWGSFLSSCSPSRPARGSSCQSDCMDDSPPGGSPSRRCASVGERRGQAAPCARFHADKPATCGLAEAPAGVRFLQRGDVMP